MLREPRTSHGSHEKLDFVAAAPGADHRGGSAGSNNPGLSNYIVPDHRNGGPASFVALRQSQASVDSVEGYFSVASAGSVSSLGDRDMSDFGSIHDDAFSDLSRSPRTSSSSLPPRGRPRSTVLYRLLHFGRRRHTVRRAECSSEPVQ